MKTTSSILEQIDTPNSGYIYYYTSVSIKDELRHLQEVMSGLPAENELLKQLKVHKSRTEEIAAILEDRDGGDTIYSYKKPPNPCPGTSSSCLYIDHYVSYYNYFPGEVMKFFINEKPYIVMECAYDELIKMQTVQIQGNPEYHAGDSVRVELPVTYRDMNGNPVSVVIVQEVSDIMYSS